MQRAEIAEPLVSAKPLIERKHENRVAAKVMPAKAVENVGHDPAQLAKYLYSAMSDFQGADHEGYCIEIMRQAFEALQVRALRKQDL